MAITVVTGLVVMMESLPAIEGLACVLRSVGTRVDVVGGTHVATTCCVTGIITKSTIAICDSSGSILCV